VEHGVDEAEQVFAVGADAGECIERLLWQRAVKALLDEFGIPENGRERSPELVAHVGHELILVLARDLKVFDSFGKLTRARLHFVEQPCILDGDDSLIGKSGQQLNLLVGDRTSVRVKVKTPMVTPSRSRGTARVVRNPPNSCNSGL